MNFEKVMQLIGRWGGTLKFFPGDPDARIGIAEEIVSMCPTIERVEWLVQRLPKLYSEWPGMKEVRAVLCSKFKPADGIESYSEIFPDGLIPSERPTAALAPPRDPRSRELPPGEVGALIRSLVGRKSF